jgi:hypothetical protein
MLRRTIIILLYAALAALLAGCPSRQVNETPEEAYHVGTWTGTIETEARMVLVGTPPPDQPAARYWNAVWRIEGHVHLNEYQDGSMDGTATGELFHWFVYSDQILDYNQIKVGQWDRYTTFEVDLTGTLTDEGYVLTSGELPRILPEGHSPTGTVDFYDFLFPHTIEGKWPQDGSRVMSGESLRVQGGDYRETAQLPSFREFDITYRWNIEKL